MEAPDLPAPVRRAILDRVKEELGEDQYQELVERVGEERLLDQVIRAAEAAPKPKKKRDYWLWLFVAICILPVFAGRWEGVAVLAMMMGLGLLQWVFGRVAEWWRSITPRM